MSNAPNFTPIEASSQDDEFPPNTKLLFQWATDHTPSLSEWGGVDSSLKYENPLESSHEARVMHPSMGRDIQRKPFENSNPFHEMGSPSIPMIPQGLNFGVSRKGDSEGMSYGDVEGMNFIGREPNALDTGHVVASMNEMVPISSSLLLPHTSSSRLPGVEMSLSSDVSVPLGGIGPSSHGHGIHMPTPTGEIPIENLLDEVHAHMRERMLAFPRSTTMDSPIEDEHVRCMVGPSSCVDVGESMQALDPDLQFLGSPPLFMNESIRFSKPCEQANIPRPSLQGEHIYVPLALPRREIGCPIEGIPSRTIVGEKDASKGKEIVGEVASPSNPGCLDLRLTLQAQRYPTDPILDGVRQDVYKFISPELDGKYVQFGEEVTEHEEEKPPKKKRTWSPEEHRLFLEGVEKLGRGNWKEISEKYVTTRTPVQIASHAQKFLAKEEQP